MAVRYTRRRYGLGRGFPMPESPTRTARADVSRGAYIPGFLNDPRSCSMALSAKTQPARAAAAACNWRVVRSGDGEPPVSELGAAAPARSAPTQDLPTTTARTRRPTARAGAGLPAWAGSDAGLRPLI